MLTMMHESTNAAMGVSSFQRVRIRVTPRTSISSQPRPFTFASSSMDMTLPVVTAGSLVSSDVGEWVIVVTGGWAGVAGGEDGNAER
jgi:hypothetical protein